MREIGQDSQFKRDLKREMKGRYRFMLEKDGELRNVVMTLRNDVPLEFIYQDHPLKGRWKGSRECHLAPDLLLVYRKIGDDLLILERLGSHADIFGM
ncbi:MAG: type II toxin-antitoxin system YafQ family toxin [Synergistaceae bacterium]|nr:type II toxin-antitoxin system YafQ family toxin [Synergistaceae bacterium]MBR0202756.1 type II toxin-antitoxin system YafQ family toxin [Synergistaceae bacterium]